MRAAATVAAWLSVLPAAAQSGHHLRWMSFFDPPPLDSLNSWINLLHTEHVAELAQTFASTGVPSLLTLTVDGSNTGGGGGADPAVAAGQGESLLCSQPCASCGHDQYVLCDDWPARLARLGALLKPHFASKAARGIFIGDELLHMGLGYDNLVNFSLALRAQFGPEAILYANMEASWLTDDKLFPRVPESWDLISADDYWDGNHSNPATAGFEASVTIYKQHVLPKLASHQRALLVPGIFAQPAHVATNDSDVMAQLQRYYDFALSDSRIAGMDPWHYYNRSGALNQSSESPYAVGAEAMPKTLALLRQIGQKTDILLRRFMLKKIICQDRLGTNIGQGEKRVRRFLIGSTIVNSSGTLPPSPPPPPPPPPPPGPQPPPSSHHPPALPPPLDPPLQPMLKIDWELLYPLAVGVEDNDGGFLDDSTLVTAFGLSKHSYPGCVATAYSYNISDPLAKWEELPVPPVPPRQEEAATIVAGPNGNEVWYCGGFNNDWQKQGNKQRTMDDMLRLYRDESGSWKWEVLPLKLPHPVDGHAVAAIDHLLFVFGGDLNEGKDRSENSSLFPPFVLKSDRFTKTG